jgi:hypothetical protein
LGLFCVAHLSEAGLVRHSLKGDGGSALAPLNISPEISAAGLTGVICGLKESAICTAQSAIINPEPLI